MSKLSRPTHQLKGKMGQVTRAPPGMVNEYQKASQPPLRILSRKQNPVGKFSGGITGISGPSLEERERRLRALASGGDGSKTDAAGGLKETLVGSSSSDEEDDLDEVDDLFDERSEPRPRPHASFSSPPRSLKAPPSRHLSSSPAAASSARPRPHSSSASPPLSAIHPTPKPSDLISSIISKPKPSVSTSTAPPPRIHSAPPSRTASPAPGAPKPMMPRKRPEVDIFNRGVKKQRVR